jgi:hypothetical protein
MIAVHRDVVSNKSSVAPSVRLLIEYVVDMSCLSCGHSLQKLRNWRAGCVWYVGLLAGLVADRVLAQLQGNIE